MSKLKDDIVANWKNEMDNTTPFTGETPIKLHSVLKYIVNSDLPIEMFMDRYTVHTTYNGSRFSTQAIQDLVPDTAKDVSSQTEWVRYEEAEAERAELIDKIARSEENQLTGAELIECICKELHMHYWRKKNDT